MGSFSRTFDDVSLVPSAGDQESRSKTALRRSWLARSSKMRESRESIPNQAPVGPAQDCCEPTPHRGDGGTNAPEQGYVPDRVTCRI